MIQSAQPQCPNRPTIPATNNSTTNPTSPTLANTRDAKTTLNTTVDSPSASRSTRASRRLTSLSPSENEYGSAFWFTYAANASLVVANALLTRYVEFVRFYDSAHTQMYLGIIIGIGMTGALLMRLSQGSAMDRYGPRLIWLASILLFCLSCVGHMVAGSFAETAFFWPMIVGLRIVMATSIAGAFGASMVSISRRVPPARMAEMIGSLGTSGFIGMVLGPSLGDYLFNSSTVSVSQVQAMFFWSAIFGLASLIFAYLATRSPVLNAPRPRRLPTFKILRKYFPAQMALVGVAMGVGMLFPFAFLADFVRTYGLGGIKEFFMVYAGTAFIVRVSIRRFAEKYGFRKMVLIGMSVQAASYLCYLPVQQWWHLFLPACTAGFAHAFLFPAIVAGGGTAFPERFRGIGTALMMGTMDFGMFLGGPAIGFLLYASGAMGYASYPTMFVVVAFFLGAIITTYALISRPQTASLKSANVH